MFNTIKQALHHGNIFRIVYVGDSLTSTEWVHPNWREIVEYVLKQELSEAISDWKIPSWQIRTINSGLDGATTKDIRERIKEYVTQYDPQLVMLMIGGNDKYFISREETKKYYEDIISELKSKGIAIALSTDPALHNKAHDARDEDLRELIRSFASKVDIFTDLHHEMKELPLETFYTFICEDGNEEAGIKSGENDFLHPNSLGNAYMAKIYLKNIYGIDFNPEMYLSESVAGIMFPSYKSS